MLRKLLIPLGMLLGVNGVLVGGTWSSQDPMECSGNQCTIDYSGSKPLKLVVPGNVKKVSLNYNGSGRLSVRQEKGSELEELRVTCVGSAPVDLSDLPAKKANVSYRGSADLDIHVTESGTITNRGSGDITVQGNGNISVDDHGSGKVYLPSK